MIRNHQLNEKESELLASMHRYIEGYRENTRRKADRIYLNKKDREVWNKVCEKNSWKAETFWGARVVYV